MRAKFVLGMFPASLSVIFCIVFSLSSAQDEIQDETEYFDPTKHLALKYFKVTSSIYKAVAPAEGNFFFSPFNFESFDIRCILAKFPAELDSRGNELPDKETQITDAFGDIVASLENDKNISFSTTCTCEGDNRPLSDLEKGDFTHTSYVYVENPGDAIMPSDETVKVHSTGESSTPAPIVVWENAFNLTAEWAAKFDKTHTTSEQFFVSPTQTKEVQMMHLTSDGLHFVDSEELNCKMLELPFKGGRLSLAVLLPNQLDGIAELESKILKINATQLPRSTSTQEVAVSLPRFNIEHSAVTIKNSTIVVEKEVFGVNEDGTEGAPATDGVHQGGSVSQSASPVVFRADHPFVFVVFDRFTKIMFHIGRVSSP